MKPIIIQPNENNFLKEKILGELKRLDFKEPLFFKNINEVVPESLAKTDDLFLIILENELVPNISSFIKYQKSGLGIGLEYCSNPKNCSIWLDRDNQIIPFQDVKNSPVDGYVPNGLFKFDFNTFRKFQANGPEAFWGGKLWGMPLETRLDFKNLTTHGEKRRALFLDRDGIIVEDHGYISKLKETQFFKEIIPLIKWANDNKWYVFVLTNQAGVARGYFSEQDVDDFHSDLTNIIEENGCKVDGWHYCPYHEMKGQDDYRRASLLRKPLPGMALLASEKSVIDFENSVMIGDKVSDALPLPGLINLHLKGNYDLSKASNPVFESHEEILGYIKDLNN